MHLSVEGLRPWDWSNRYCSISGSDPLRQSSSLIVTGTVVKPQQPTNQPTPKPDESTTFVNWHNWIDLTMRALIIFQEQMKKKLKVLKKVSKTVPEKVSKNSEKI